MITHSLNFLENITYAIVCILTFAMLVITLLAILPFATPWVEEVTTLLFGWFIFLGAGVLMRIHGHVAISAFVSYLPLRWQRFIYRVNILIILFVSATIFTYGFKMFSLAIKRGQESLYLDIPFYINYAAIPLGSLILIIFAVEAFFKVDEGLKLIVIADDVTAA